MYDALDLEQPPFDVKDCLADETFVPASVTEEARAEEQVRIQFGFNYMTTASWAHRAQPVSDDTHELLSNESDQGR